MQRSVLALLAGVLTLIALVIAFDHVYTQLDPHAITAHGGAVGIASVVVFLYLQVANVVSGFVTGKVAVRKPAQHAACLGLLTLLLSISSTRMVWNEAAHWYLVACVILALPITTLGGGLAK